MVVDCQRAIGRLSAGLLALLVVVGAGCKAEIHPCDTEDPPPDCNQCPRTVGIMPDDAVEVGDSARLNVASFFEDADSGDILIYTAESSDESVVTVEMDGAVLTYAGVDGGEADITVTATDKEDCAKEQEFEVTVVFPNRAPQCEWGLPPPPFVYAVGLSGELDVPCWDDDNDPLTYTAESSDPDVFSVTLAGSRINFEALEVGTAVLTVTATDLEGLTGEATADIIIVEDEG